MVLDLFHANEVDIYVSPVRQELTSCTIALLSEWNFGFVTLPSRPGSFTKRRGSGSRNLRRRGGKAIQFMSQPELTPASLTRGGVGHTWCNSFVFADRFSLQKAHHLDLELLDPSLT